MGTNKVCGDTEVEQLAMTQLTAPISSQDLILDGEKITVYFCDIPGEATEVSAFIRKNAGFLSSKLISATPKRQAEFIAGRLASCAGLEALGIHKHVVASNPDRSPIWPENIAGAISHKTQLAAAAVSRKFNLIGLDLETTFPEKTIQRISRKIINDSEQQRLLASPLLYPVAFTQVFSAKETLYKAIYPYVGRYLGFDTSEVVSIAKDHLMLQLRQDVADVVPCSCLFKVHTLSTAGHILTLAVSATN